MTTFRGFDLEDFARSFCDVMQDSGSVCDPRSLMCETFVLETRETLVDIMGATETEADALAVPVAAATVLELCRRLETERLRDWQEAEAAADDRTDEERAEDIATMQDWEPETDESGSLYSVDGGEPVSFVAFIEHNQDLDAFERGAILSLAVGQEHTFGGGAAAEWTIRRVR